MKERNHPAMASNPHADHVRHVSRGRFWKQDPRRITVQDIEPFNPTNYGKAAGWTAVINTLADLDYHPRHQLLNVLAQHGISRQTAAQTLHRAHAAGWLQADSTTRRIDKRRFRLTAYGAARWLHHNQRIPTTPHFTRTPHQPTDDTPNSWTPMASAYPLRIALLPAWTDPVTLAAIRSGQAETEDFGLAGGSHPADGPVHEAWLALLPTLADLDWHTKAELTEAAVQRAAVEGTQARQAIARARGQSTLQIHELHPEWHRLTPYGALRWLDYDTVKEAAEARRNLLERKEAQRTEGHA